MSAMPTLKDKPTTEGKSAEIINMVESNFWRFIRSNEDFITVSNIDEVRTVINTDPIVIDPENWDNYSAQLLDLVLPAMEKMGASREDVVKLLVGLSKEGRLHVAQAADGKFIILDDEATNTNYTPDMFVNRRDMMLDDEEDMAA